MLASSWETVSAPWLEIDELIDCGNRVVVRWRGGGSAAAARSLSNGTRHMSIR